MKAERDKFGDYRQVGVPQQVIIGRRRIENIQLNWPNIFTCIQYQVNRHKFAPKALYQSSIPLRQEEKFLLETTETESSSNSSRDARVW